MPSKSKKLPVIFYRSISAAALAGKEPKKQSANKPTSLSAKNNFSRQVWLWSAVSLVMIFIIFFWIYSLPVQIKINNSTNDSTLFLFKNNKDELKKILTDQSEKTRQKDQLNNLLIKSVWAASASSTAKEGSSLIPALTSQQIEELKNKIQNKK